MATKTKKENKLPVVYRVFWVGDVDDNNLLRVMNEINHAMSQDPGNYLIDLWIRTDGGQLNIAQAFLDFVRVNKVDLATTAFGQVSSAGTLIFGAGLVRRACRMSRFFFHKLYVPIDSCNLDIDDSNDLHGSIKTQHKLSENLLKRLYKLSQEQIDFLVKKKRRWSPQQMKKMGIVDQII